MYYKSVSAVSLPSHPSPRPFLPPLPSTSPPTQHRSRGARGQSERVLRAGVTPSRRLFQWTQGPEHRSHLRVDSLGPPFTDSPYCSTSLLSSQHLQVRPVQLILIAISFFASNDIQTDIPLWRLNNPKKKLELDIHISTLFSVWPFSILTFYVLF